MSKDKNAGLFNIVAAITMFFIFSMFKGMTSRD